MLVGQGQAERDQGEQCEGLTCVLGTNVGLDLGFLHGDEVTGRAADREHPLLLIHMQRHVADKLHVELCLEATYMAARGGWREE